MNRVVKAHYPVSKLPEELRVEFDPRQLVTVEITAEEPGPEKPLTLKEIFALRQPPFRSGKEIDEDVRRHRDEWDD